jgi:SagB-type dehydrogenase family enzyme
MPELKKSSGYHYFFETKLDRGRQMQSRPMIGATEPFKKYPRAEKIPLPLEAMQQDSNFWQLLRQRRSRRRYGPDLLTTRELAALLWAAQGTTSRTETSLPRPAPSAGGLHPLETYVAIEKAEQLGRGLYHLDVSGFQLEWLSAEPYGREIAHAVLEQDFLAEAAAIFLWSAVFRRTMRKYGDRGLRYILLDAGHACQNVLLAAEALGLAACPVAAFYDDELNDLLLLDGEDEAILYLAAVGRKTD